MLMAADLSMRQGWLNQQDVQRVENLVDKARLPTRAPAHMDYDAFMKIMGVDKKVRAGKINLVLLRALGHAFVTADFDPELLRETIGAHRALEQD